MRAHVGLRRDIAAGNLLPSPSTLLPLILFTPFLSLLKLWEPSGSMQRKISRRSVHLAPSETVWGPSYEGFSVDTHFQPSQALGAFWFDAA